MAAIVFTLILTGLLHQYSYTLHPVIFGVAEHLYTLPILWAALRLGWIGGLLAGSFSVVAIVWIAADLPPGASLAVAAEAPVFLLVGLLSGWAATRWQGATLQMTDLKSELRERDQLLMRSGKLSAAGELAVGLAHELRHPVASIRGICALLRRQDVGGEVRDECLAILDREGERIERLLGELLRFAKPHTPQIVRADPRVIVDEAFALVGYARGADADAKIQLRKEIDPSIDGLLCDPEQIKQVMVNLLLNASHAMPGGGIATVRIDRRDGVGSVLVVDQGHGIAPELMDKVFLPFVTTRPNGTGLGLAIAKQIVAQHGAELIGRRNPEQGMTFGFSLPLPPQENR